MPSNELPEGARRCVTLAGRKVLLCRVDGQVHAVSDTCPHEGISLSLGSLQGHRLQCPLHGSEFDIRTGDVLSEPAEQDLECHEVVEQDGWINLVT